MVFALGFVAGVLVGMAALACIACCRMSGILTREEAAVDSKQTEPADDEG